MTMTSSGAGLCVASASSSELLALVLSKSSRSRPGGNWSREAGRSWRLVRQARELRLDPFRRASRFHLSIGSTARRRLGDAFIL
jgi:hypothetical protein